MRQALKDQEVGLDKNFRYRGKNQTRVETFSDAAFALAITLIVLSSSVPKNYNDLWLSLKDVIPFGLCVVLVMIIWYQHYIFFLRYGLQNIRIVLLNTFLIFLILVYVYPLKFLFRVLFELYQGIFTSDQALLNHLFTEVISFEDTRNLMIIYGFGASLIFFTLSMMYRYAYKLRKPLELDAYETYATRESLRSNLLMGSIPFLSGLIALVGIFGNQTFLISGFTYLLYPLVMFIFARYSAKKRKAFV